MGRRSNSVKVAASERAAMNMNHADWEYVEYLQSQILSFLGDKAKEMIDVKQAEGDEYPTDGMLKSARSYDYVATILRNHGPMTPQDIQIKSEKYLIRMKKGKARKDGEKGLSPRTVNFALRWLLKRNLVKKYRLVQNDQRQPTYEWIGG